MEMDVEEENNNNYRSKLKEIVENTMHKKVSKDELFDILFFNPFKLLDNANILSTIEIPENIDRSSAISRNSKIQRLKKEEDKLIRNILEVRKRYE